MYTGAFSLLHMVENDGHGSPSESGHLLCNVYNIFFESGRMLSDVYSTSSRSGRSLRNVCEASSGSGSLLTVLDVCIREQVLAEPYVWHVFWISTHAEQFLLHVFLTRTHVGRLWQVFWISMLVGGRLWHVFWIMALGAWSPFVPWRFAHLHVTNLGDLVQRLWSHWQSPVIKLKAGSLDGICHSVQDVFWLSSPSLWRTTRKVN